MSDDDVEMFVPGSKDCHRLSVTFEGDPIVRMGIKGRRDEVPDDVERSDRLTQNHCSHISRSRFSFDIRTG